MERSLSLVKLLDVDISNKLPTKSEFPIAETLHARSSPNNPPWSWWIAVFVWVASVLLVLIVPSIAVLAYVAPLRNQFASQEALVDFVKSDPTAVILQVVAIIPVHLLTLLLSWAIVTRFRTYSFSETLGWKSGGMRWWHYLAILLGIFALSAAVMNFFPEADNDLLRILRSSRAAVFILAALATFTAPIVEEVIYRGILYSAFQRTFGVAAAVAIVTALFALVHFPQYWPSYSTLFLLTILSLTLTMVRAKSGNLLPCIILHTIFNGIQSLALIAEPYFPTPPPDTAHNVSVAILSFFGR